MKIPEALMNFAYWVIGSLTDIYYRVRESRAGRLPLNLLCFGLMALGIVVAFDLICQFLAFSTSHCSLRV